MTVLYFPVEDSAVNRRLLDRMLVRMGYRSIFQATNGLEALELARRSMQHFDIILLDLSMPQMDGIQFLSSLEVNGRPFSLVLPPFYALAVKIVVTQFECLYGWLCTDTPFSLSPSSGSLSSREIPQLLLHQVMCQMIHGANLKDWEQMDEL